MNRLSNCCKGIIRGFCTINSRNVIEKLTNRSLLRVSGSDASALMQGLVTNDVNQLSNISVGCLYAMFLNNKGRILYDSIIYKIPETDTFFVEVDKNIAAIVQKHLNLYRLRRNVTIENMDDKFQIWAQFNEEILNKNPKETHNMFDEKLVPCLSPKGTDTAIEKENGQILEYIDPRTPILGSRILTSSDNVVKKLYGCETKLKYKLFRYRLGIAEGTEELPVGNCFPLEANCDYLHGVSFHKGCYLGQELTARSHHTGVIRKRYMPLYFEKPLEGFKQDETVKAGDNNVGKLRGAKDNLGLGLLRIAQVNDKRLIVGNVGAYTVKPVWWPSDKVREDCKAVQM